MKYIFQYVCVSVKSEPLILYSDGKRCNIVSLIVSTVEEAIPKSHGAYMENNRC